MLSTYRRILSVPGAALFSATGLVARFPISMISLGIVLLVSTSTGSYALAGSVTASFLIASALFAVVQARLVDRLGQSRVLPPAIGVFAAGLRGCGVPRLRRLEVPVCGGLEAGLVRGRGVGAALASSATDNLPWLALTAGPGLTWAVRPRLALSLALDLVIPLFKLFSGNYPNFQWLNWMNTYQALIIPTLSFGLPLCVWNLTAFFRQLPIELEQAAMVDGCTPGQAFVRVILPLAAPGVFTTAIITFIAVWNDYMIALQFGTTPEMYTSIVAVSKFTGAYGFDTPWGTIMAAGVLITVPLLVAVLIFQRRIVAGLTAGGVK